MLLGQRSIERERERELFFWCHLTPKTKTKTKKKKKKKKKNILECKGRSFFKPVLSQYIRDNGERKRRGQILPFLERDFILFLFLFLFYFILFFRDFGIGLTVFLVSF